MNELDVHEMRKVEELFKYNLVFFGEAMTAVMAQILLWRRNGDRPNLNDLRLKDIFRFVAGKIQLKSNLNSRKARIRLAAAQVNGVIFPPRKLTEAETEFRRRQGLEKFIRGKYLFWLFVESALQIHKAIPKLFAKHKRAPKVRLSLGQANAMVVIAPRVRIPSSLKAFIDNNYRQFIEAQALPA